jgi:hypothetical protein
VHKDAGNVAYKAKSFDEAIANYEKARAARGTVRVEVRVEVRAGVRAGVRSAPRKGRAPCVARWLVRVRGGWHGGCMA